MTQLFISHSSKNNAEALALSQWLTAEGWDDQFLDIHPLRGLVAGERWERALHQAAGRCDAVLFLVSPDWLRSDWCRREFTIAKQLGKRLFVLLLDGAKRADVEASMKEVQLVDLEGLDCIALVVTLPGAAESVQVQFSRVAMLRLREGLKKAGLDPQSFPWPPSDEPNRAPYRGLAPLEAQDAGIFFGREAPITELLAQLRGLRESAPPRFLAILGASGAGKSSFLRAGILPRLARDDRHFLPLPVIRPERAVLSGSNGLVECLWTVRRERKLNWSRRQIEEAVATGASALQALLQELAQHCQVPEWDGSQPQPPSLVLAIDQAEELFQAEGAEQAGRFLSLLAELLQADTPKLIVLCTIRSDGYEPLQSTPALADITQRVFSLPPMPHGAFRQVIEAPVALLKHSPRPLRIEPQLTEALLRDIAEGGAKDALPLLAFTLERLYMGYSADGLLSLKDYQDLGRIAGAIEKAVAAALEQAQRNPKIPNDRDECLKLLRRGLIPWMAGIDRHTNLPYRKVALLSQVPEEARALIEHFVQHRLLAKDKVPEGDTTIEPAHEALLRQWTTLRGWLKEDTAALATLESVKAASRDWDANKRSSEWLTHSTGRLKDAEKLKQRRDFVASLDTTDSDYLVGCRIEKNRRRNRALLFTATFVLAVSVTSWIAWISKQSERQQVELYQQQAIQRSENDFSRASLAFDQGETHLGVESLLASLETPTPSALTSAEYFLQIFGMYPVVDSYSCGLPARQGSAIIRDSVFLAEPGEIVKCTNGVIEKRLQAAEVRSINAHNEILILTTAKQISILDGDLDVLWENPTNEIGHLELQDNETAFATSKGEVFRIDLVKGRVEKLFEPDIGADEFHLDDKSNRALILDFEGAEVIDLSRNRSIFQRIELDEERGGIYSGAITPSGEIIILGRANGYDHFDLKRGTKSEIHNSRGEAREIRVSPTSAHFSIAWEDNSIQILPIEDGESFELEFRSEPNALFSPDGLQAVIYSSDSFVAVKLDGNKSAQWPWKTKPYTLSFSHDSRYFTTVYESGDVSTWATMDLTPTAVPIKDRVLCMNSDSSAIIEELGTGSLLEFLIETGETKSINEKFACASDKHFPYSGRTRSRDGTVSVGVLDMGGSGFIFRNADGVILSQQLVEEAAYNPQLLEDGMTGAFVTGASGYPSGIVLKSTHGTSPTRLIPINFFSAMPTFQIPPGSHTIAYFDQEANLKLSDFSGRSLIPRIHQGISRFGFNESGNLLLVEGDRTAFRSSATGNFSANDLKEALVALHGVHVNESGSIELLPSEKIIERRNGILQTVGDDFARKVLTWHLSSPTSRSMNFISNVETSAHIENLIAQVIDLPVEDESLFVNNGLPWEEDAWELDEAYNLDPGHPLILLALSVFEDRPETKALWKRLSFPRFEKDARLAARAAEILLIDKDTENARKAAEIALALPSATEADKAKAQAVLAKINSAESS